MKFDPEGYKLSKWMLIALIGMFLIISLVLIIDSFKTRNDFKVITGQVTKVGNTKIKKFHATSFVYYFGLSTHKQLFGIGTNNKGIPILDTSFTSLEIGDKIQVTYEDNWVTKNEQINLLVHEIVLGEKILYDNIARTYWNSRMKTGLICLIIGLGLTILLIIFHRKNQILTRNIKTE